MKPEYKPVPKVTAVAITGYTAAVLVLALGYLGVDVTPEDVTTVGNVTLAAIVAITTLINTVAGYLKRS